MALLHRQLATAAIYSLPSLPFSEEGFSYWSLSEEGFSYWSLSEEGFSYWSLSKEGFSYWSLSEEGFRYWSLSEEGFRYWSHGQNICNPQQKSAEVSTLSEAFLS